MHPYIYSKSAFSSHDIKVCLHGHSLPVMVVFTAVLYQFNYALLLQLSHSLVTGNHLSAVERLLGEFEVAKKGATKRVIFTKVVPI